VSTPIEVVSPMGQTVGRPCPVTDRRSALRRRLGFLKPGKEPRGLDPEERSSEGR